MPSARWLQRRSSSSTESLSSGATPKPSETAGKNSLSLYKPFCFNKIFNSISCYNSRPFAVSFVLGGQSAFGKRVGMRGMVDLSFGLTSGRQGLR